MPGLIYNSNVELGKLHFSMKICFLPHRVVCWIVLAVFFWHFLEQVLQESHKKEIKSHSYIFPGIDNVTVRSGRLHR